MRMTPRIATIRRIVSRLDAKDICSSLNGVSLTTGAMYGFVQGLEFVCTSAAFLCRIGQSEGRRDKHQVPAAGAI